MLCKKCNVDKNDNEFRITRHRLADGTYKLYKRLTCRSCECEYSKIKSKKDKRWLTAESKSKVNKYRKRRYFHTRAEQLIKISKRQKTYCPYPVTQLMISLATKWKTQKGLCALSGIKLTRDNAEIDHIIPISRGGQSVMDNLRWVMKDVNRAKQGLLDPEFFDLIKKIINTTY